MRRHLLTLILLAATVPLFNGCARRQPEPTLGPVPANGFVKGWGAALNLQRDQSSRIYLRDDLVFLYTRQNQVYILTASGGELIGLVQPASAASELRPPTLLGDKIVIPTIATLEVYDRRGRKLESIELERASRSSAAALNNFLYLGMDFVRGGRLVKLDINRPYGRTMWELMTFGPVSAAPAVYEETIFAASEDGRVYAVEESRDPVWLIEGGVFRTEGSIIADLRADDYGVYAAATDSKLYCLDRLTGRIRWTYFGGAPLRDAPVVTADRVYQQVPGRGLVAINKTEGQSSRNADWVAPNARQFLSADERHVYVLGTDSAVIALDKVSGQPRFRSNRRDFAIAASNPAGTMIYAATRAGEVLAIQPVLKPGTVGEIVLRETVIPTPLAYYGSAGNRS